MQGQSIHFRLLATAFVLLTVGSYSVVGVTRPETNSTAELKPVASFDFIHIEQLGEDSISHGRKSAIVGKVSQVESPFGCAAEFDGKGRISRSEERRVGKECTSRGS